ncbi:MAG: hypothetical protein JJU13_09210 [Balneolaceae bacterium]|nr:hypothetical protein [Balneolaceae bacterium]
MLSFYEYHLPFKQPLETGAGSFLHRKGILISFSEDGRYFLSEASPLPGFSQDTLPDVTSALLENSELLSRFLASSFNKDKLNTLLKKLPSLPSLQFGLSFLGAEILSYRKNISFGKLFGLNEAKSIGVNDVIGKLPAEQVFERIQTSIELGFTTIKLKAVPPLITLADVLKKIHSSHPGIRFRLDANRSWSPDELKSLSALFSHLPVDYIEEPFPMESDSEIKKAQKESALPLALDESISSISRLNKLLTGNRELYLIIKPMLLGNLFELAGTITRQRSRCEHIVITTSLESAVGRSIIATAASMIGDRTLPHGLNTGELFERDLFTTTGIKHGQLSLSKPLFRHISFDALPEKYLKRLE